MKKTLYLMLFVLMLSATVNAQTDWITKNLDEKLSVKLPAEPEKTGAAGMDIYTAKGKDGVGYNVNVIDLNLLAHLDSATLASLKDNQGFADQIGKGMASKMTDYTVGDVKMGKWKTYTTYSVLGTGNADKSKLNILMIIISSKVYMLACMIPATMVTKDDEVFFGSADLVKK